MDILFFEREIKENIKRIATEINEHYNNSIDIALGHPITIIPILNGGIFFYVDLVREFTFDNEMGVISTTHYPNGKEVRDLEIKFLDAKIENRSVLLVDEICYTGDTLVKLANLCYDKGAEDVKTVVLINQPKEHENIKHIPTWSALNYYGKEWVYGYGMDLKGLHRNKVNILK